MRAIVQTGYGHPERVLTVGEVEPPTPGENQVLVRVVASSINAGDWRRVYASPFLVRFMSGFTRPKERQLGGDVAGIVEAVGPGGATQLRPGDEVFGIRSGAFAEYVAGRSFVRKPVNLSLADAATVPIAGVTALQALQKYGNVQPGQRVLVNGAGGGVGTFAVQIAKALGAYVAAVTSTDKVELMASLHADRVFDHGREDFTKSDEKYDVIVDIGGNKPVRALRRMLRPGGRIVMVGAGHGGFGVFGRFVGSWIRKRLHQPIVSFIAYGPYEEQLTTLRELLEAGKVKPVIDRTYAFTEIADAIRYVATEKARGKVVLTVAPASSADSAA